MRNVPLASSKSVLNIYYIVLLLRQAVEQRQIMKNYTYFEVKVHKNYLFGNISLLLILR